MAIGKMSVWYLKPGLPGYVAGMDLGKPDEIVTPESYLTRGRVHPTIVSPNSQKSTQAKASGETKNKRFRLGREEYLSVRRSGLSRDQVCERYNIKIGTLRTYLHDWGIQKPADELEELEAMY